jgi:hypothetical protein
LKIMYNRDMPIQIFPLKMITPILCRLRLKEKKETQA